MQCAMRVHPGAFHDAWLPQAGRRAAPPLHAMSRSRQAETSGRQEARGVAAEPSLPHHVALIMDGNARWAAQRSQPVAFGHQSGVRALRETVNACLSRGIACLTVYALSEENWARNPREVEFLLNLVETVLQAELESLRSNGVRMAFIGNLSRLPPGMQRQIERAEAHTAGNRALHLTIALSYASRQDITSAAQALVAAAVQGRLEPEQVTPELLAAQLSTGRLPPGNQHIDLVIRTSGERRLSNFLLWESAYAELYFTNVLWPDFGAEHLDAALHDYAARERRYGSRPQGCG